MFAARTGLGVFGAIALLVACGGSSGSVFGDGNNSSGSGNNNGSSGDQGSFSTDPVGTNAACVTSLKSASLPPVNLVLMYDKSGSMGDPAEGGDPNQKWIPVNTGMKAFFSDPASAGYNASLQFFPAPGDVTATCGAAYATPLVPLTSLGTPAALISALDAAKPQGGTPTLPALQGAITYATATAKSNPDEKTVVVLITDGEPGMMVNGTFQAGCSNNDISHIAATAQTANAAAPPIPTYVIGVGSSFDVTNLNQIAAAGGTKQAFIVSVSDPTQTKTQLQQAFDAIRSQVKVGCDFGLPAPPAGQQLDKNRVNVGFTAGGGQETPLVYSADCSAPNGWHYDDINNPTKIELCASTCSTVQADHNGKLTIAFGCITNQGTK
jgi:hypothetical protein